MKNIVNNIRSIISTNRNLVIGLGCFIVIVLASALFINKSAAPSQNSNSTTSSSASNSSSTNSSDNNGSSSVTTTSQQVITSSTPNIAPQRILISNYDSIVKNLPDTQKEGIEGMIYYMAKQNGHDNTSLTAQIRNNTYTQSYNSSNRQYTTSFVVDLPGIRQSYLVQNRYNSQNPTAVGYPTIISCPPTSYLIYGDFNCQELKMHQ